MASKTFTAEEWRKINAELDRDPEGYGIPKRTYGSVVLGSFNCRKLGSARKRNAATWKFLGRLCKRIDLLAVQEVMDDTSGLERLRDEMGPEFALLISDKTGAFPGDAGLNERMAFIYRWSVVRRGTIVSDVTYDRTKVLGTLEEEFEAIQKAVEKYRQSKKDFEEKKRKTKPKLQMPVFLSFIRQPYAASFELAGHPETEPYRFMAINAHLIYGELADRKKEFNALLEWIIEREKENADDAFPAIVLMGDLNLDFDNPATDILDIDKYLQKFENKKGEEISPYFPFLDVHPRKKILFRTNARQKQTFDHIALFFPTRRIPREVSKRAMGSHDRGPDYGLVNFVDLFANALHGVEFEKLSKARRKAFYAKFEHSVSDHMPIWFRIPLPDE